MVSNVCVESVKTRIRLVVENEIALGTAFRKSLVCLKPQASQYLTMPNGVKIPESTCWAVLRMHICQYPPQAIQVMTDVSVRQQRRIISLWRRSGCVFKDTAGNDNRGRPRQLRTEELLVSFCNAWPCLIR